MTTESKKLQTRMDGPYLLGFNDAGLYAAYENDARIAHEQRGVMRKMEEALRSTHKVAMYGTADAVREKIIAAINAAAPFLED